MDTLVIGGTRNLGPDLVAALHEGGHQVAVLNRGITEGRSAAVLPAGTERLRADRSDRAALSAALRGRSFDLVVDTTLYTGTDAQHIAQLLDGRCGRYVFWSTGQVYLVRTGPRPPYREEDYEGPLMAEPPATRPGDHRNWVYGVDKRAAEDALSEAHASRGFPAVSLRMPMINSERDHYGRIAGYVLRLLDGGPILVPSGPALPLRHVYGGDVVRATLLGCEAPGATGRAFNIGQDETLELEEMLRLLAGCLAEAGRGVPELGFRSAARAELDARGLLPSCSPFSDSWMSALDNSTGRKDLGVSYTPIREYLPRIVRAALELEPARVPGYARRKEELELAART